MTSKMASWAIIQHLPRHSHALVARHVSRVLPIPISRNKVNPNSSWTWRSLSSGIGFGSSSQYLKPMPSATSPKTSTTTPESEADVQSSPDLMAKLLFKRHRGMVIERSQILDANQLQKLCITLNRKDLSGQDMTKEPPTHGTPIPPGYHLVYFTPSDMESELGPDGTDQTFSPPAPFNRRMWSGGLVRWNPENPLRVGDMVIEKTRLLGVTAKADRHGNPMLLARVGKVFSNEKGFAVEEERSWVFLETALRPAQPIQEQRNDELELSRVKDIKSMVGRLFPVRDSAGQPFPVRNLRWSAKALFRFSALTFNAHMIHYNDPYSRYIEGRPGLVVHGPLNLINMMDYWRDVHGQDGKLQPVEVTYRATSPVHATEHYHIVTFSTATSSSTTNIAGKEAADQKSPLLEYGLVIMKDKKHEAPLVGQKTIDVMRGSIRAIPSQS